MPQFTREQLERATEAERRAIEESLQRDLALLSPLSYAMAVSPWVKDFGYLRLLDRLIVDLIEGKLINPRTGKPYDRLAVSVPPQHGKSTLISEHTPPWFLTRYPSRRVILTSYEADFARGWGRKGRNHVRENPQFGLELDEEAQAADNWEVKGNQGGMSTAGVGGAITGKGAHLLIIDDPVKNAEEANSEIIRAKAWDWVRSTALSRLRRGGVCIVLQTRWHEDDLTGKLLQHEREKWFYVNLPALALEDDILGREPGAALCPELYNEEELASIRESVGQYWWSALYQGSPTTIGSGIISRPFRYWEFSPGVKPTHVVKLAPEGGGQPDEWVDRKGLTRFQTVDLALTLKDTSDFSVICTWDVTRDRDLILVDRVRIRMEGPDHRTKLLELYRRWRPQWVSVESAAFGLAVVQELRRMGLPVRELKAKGDKVSRAIVGGDLIQRGKVFFPKSAPWLHEWEAELVAFPRGQHDDQVDNLSYAAHEVTLGRLSFVARNPEKEPVTLEERVKANLNKQVDKQIRKRRQGLHSHPLGRHW